MSTRVLALGLVAALAACGRKEAPAPRRQAAAAPAPAAEPAVDAAGRLVHVQRLFTIALPREWERVRHEDSGGLEQRPGENLVRFEDGRGRFVVVAFDPLGAGFTADAIWTLAPLPAGDAFAVAAEGPPCRAARFGSSSEAMDAGPEECPAGDGRLTLAATVDLRGHRYAFFFGDDRRERGVDLAAFRDALATFRAR